MKNSTLDELTEIVKDAYQHVPDVSLHGSGVFRFQNGNLAAPSDMLSSMYKARLTLDKAVQILENEPRHASPKRGNGDG